MRILFASLFMAVVVSWVSVAQVEEVEETAFKDSTALIIPVDSPTDLMDADSVLSAPDSLMAADSLAILDSLRRAEAERKAVWAMQRFEEGLSHKKLGEWNAAARCFREALEADATLKEVWMHHGDVCLAQGLLDEAARAYSQVLADTADARAYLGKAKVLLAQREDHLAEPYLDTALRIDSTIPEAWFLKANRQFLLAEYDEALHGFNQVTSLDQQHAMAWHDRGSAQRMLGDLFEARNSYATALRLDTTMALFHTSMGAILIELGDAASAMMAFDEAVRLDPSDARAWNHKGVIHLGKDEFEEALAAFSRAIQAQPGWAMPWNNRGNAYYQSQRFNEALNDYNEAIRLNRGYGIALMNRGNTQDMLQNMPAACEDWRRAEALGLAAAGKYVKMFCTNQNQ